MRSPPLPRSSWPWMLVAALALLVSACDERRRLSGDELRARFADQTARGHHALHGYDFASYYEASGALRSYQGGASQARRARWWVAGDAFCLRWEDTPGDLCRAVVTDDEGRYWKVQTRRDGDEEDIVSFWSFTPGNPDRL